MIGKSSKLQFAKGKRLEGIKPNPKRIQELLDHSLILANDQRNLRPTLNLRAKALYRYAHHLFRLIKDFSISPDFSDKNRILEILRKYHNSLEQNIVCQAQRFAVNLSASTLNPTGRLTEVWFGTEHLHLLRKLIKELPHSLTMFIEKMEQIHQAIFFSASPRVAITCDENLYQ